MKSSNLYHENKLNYIKLISMNDSIFTSHDFYDINNINKNYIDRVKTLYNSNSDAPGVVSKDYDYNITYGEITFEGLDTLVNYLVKNNISFENFLDIGSGRAGSVFYMAGYNFIKKSIGVEIVKKRHNFALNNHQKVKSLYPDVANKIILLNDDFMNINIKNIFNKDSPIFIWISNLCFTQEANKKILDCIIKNIINKGYKIVICCSSQLPACKELNLKESFTAKMSWTDNSNVNVYLLE